MDFTIELAKIHNKPAREQVYEALKTAILSGQVAIGQSLPERELAKALGVSRTPLREALVKLDHEGLVDIQDYKGVVVSRISREEFEAVMQVREILEGHAARLAAEEAPDEEIEIIQALFAELLGEIEAGDVSADITLNTAFHSNVARWAGNAVLERLICSYEERQNQFLLAFFRMPRTADMLQSYREHCSVIDALRARNGDEAAALMVAHISSSARRSAHLFPAGEEGSDAARTREGCKG